jgi:tetratricopeptide (TPR) repeat protein
MALLTICSTVLYSFWRFKKTLPLTRVIFFGTAWFFATLSIESSIIPIVDVIFEHRMYLPSFGIFLIISTLLVMVADRCRQKGIEEVIFLSVIITALVFTGVTYSRNNLWNDKIVFWQDAANKSPGKSRVITSLGCAYAEKGYYNRGILFFKKAIFIDPYDVIAHQSLAIIYGQFGLTKEQAKENEVVLQIIDLKKAINKYKMELRIKPNSAEIHNNLGIALAELGQTNEAIKEFRTALLIKPNSADILFNLGIALGKLGRTNEVH